MELFRPVLGRIVGSLVAALATWLEARFGWKLDPASQAQLSAGILVTLMTTFSIVYALVHKAVSAKVNPADAATPAMAEAGKTEARALKQVP